MAKRQDNPEDTGENLNEGNGDDNFGLPDLEYKPLEPIEETPETSSPTYFSSDMNTENVTPESSGSETNYSYTPAEEPKSSAPIIIVIIIGLVLVVAGFLVYQYVYKPKAEKAKKEELAKLEAQKRKAEDDRLAKEREEAERRRLEEDKTATKTSTSSVGTIETLSERTGNYHVVISSAVDGDLIMDHAKKLSKAGTSSMIVPPFGKKKFYRLVIGSYDSFAEAQSSADGMKTQYGDAIWVIKY